MCIYFFNFVFYKIFIIFVLLCCSIFIPKVTLLKQNFHIFNFAKCIRIYSEPNGVLRDILNKPSLTHNFLHRFAIFSSSPVNRRNYTNPKNNNNCYSFVPYNTLNSTNKLPFPSFNKIELRPIEYTKNDSELSHSRNTFSRVYLLESIKNWFLDEVVGWYVPPMPIGEKASYILKKEGPLQSDEDRKALLDKIGATEDDSVYTVFNKYRNFIKNKPKISYTDLNDYFLGYVRRAFVEDLEKMERAASQGLKSWTEYWRPNRKEKPVFDDDSVLSVQDKSFLTWFVPAKEAEQRLTQLQKKRRRYFGINTRRFRGLIRITKDFKSRLTKCSTTMIPLFLLGLVPKLGSWSIGISSIVAAKIIYGDRKNYRTQFLDTEKYLLKSEYDRSETVKTLATLFIVALHTTIGYVTSTLVNFYTRIGSILSPETINAFFINLQLTLCSLIYDTSEMTFEEKVKLANGTLGLEQPESQSNPPSSE